MAEWIAIPPDDARLQHDGSIPTLDTGVTLDCPCGERIRIPNEDDRTWYHPYVCKCQRVYRVRCEVIVEEHV